MKILSNKELQSLIKDCQSVKAIKGENIIWKERVGLDSDGKLIPMDEFNKMNLIYPDNTPKVKKTAHEISLLKKAKASFKKSFQGYLYKGPFDKSILRHIEPYIVS
jgi:hypothetical protein